MASTNVEYYEKQKELQDKINKSEQERLRLDQQLKAYFQSDQRLAKLKAVRLHNYWKKICEDEKRSKQRNEQYLRECERIDTHTTSLAARTERLCMLKKQYEESIERKYPNWRELCQAKMTGQVVKPPAESPASAGGEPTSPQEVTDPIAEKVKLQMSQIVNTKPTNVMNIRAIQQQSNSSQHHPSQSVHPQSSYPSQTPQYQAPATYHSPAQQSYATPQHNMTSAQTRVLSQAAEPAPQNTYVQDPIVHIPGQGDRLGVEGNSGDAGRISETPRDVSGVSNTQSDTARDRSEDTGPLPVQNISIQKKTAHVQEKHQQPTTTVPTMEPEDDEDDVDFGSDVEVPLSDAQAPKERQRTVSGGDNSRDDSISTSSRAFQRGSSFHSSKRWSEYGCVKPELTLEGVMYLLKIVQEDFPHAFATDGYYKSYRPDSAARQEIINKANNKSELASFDPNQVSMVMLEQLLLVVRSLKEGCIVSDALLEQKLETITQNTIKQRLSPDARTLWDNLFNHFALLLHHKIMEPNEIAAIFVPCIVEDGSLKQNQAYQLVVRLLAMVNGEETDDASSLASPVRQPDRKTTTPAEANVNSETYDGKVPPLKFGSLLEKPLTDDESTSFFSSAPREKMPLNETDAYKNMLSGTLKSTQSSHHNDEDTDDDVEKEFASVLSPRTPVSNSAPQAVANFDPSSRPPQIEDDEEEESEMSSPTGGISSPVYVPTAMQPPRSTMNSTGSNPPTRQIAGIKISSDLDSDSDIDVLKAVTEKKQAQDLDDFEFFA